MIEAGFEFDVDVESILGAFDSLPEVIRPTYFSSGETVEGESQGFADKDRLSTLLGKSRSGFFLHGPGGNTFSFRMAAGSPVFLDCFLDIHPELAATFVQHVAKARPVFGYACSPSERVRRNRVDVAIGSNKVEAWVGRGAERALPGIYWVTLVSAATASRHGVPLSALAKAAKESKEIVEGQHYFRFHDEPDGWSEGSAASSIIGSIPGIFDIDRERPRIEAARDILELTAILRRYA